MTEYDSCFLNNLLLKLNLIVKYKKDSYSNNVKIEKYMYDYWNIFYSCCMSDINAHVSYIHSTVIVWTRLSNKCLKMFTD